uniref:Integrase, catalytic region, zinc finger, CCHC-type, peptidase aspartic, catalytic n=1 Tax=Tanacetum cinerariifolium TaxID=118510 RepID=A0A6L2L159_TANCI|nr:integrase, catalytic region, zinc finger, CCHC-type, peptidase aspartic, catalytic [Tanacetum cinerariifolium]
MKEYFQLFEHGVYKEHVEMKAVFNQMQTEVAKCSVDNKYFKIEKKKLRLDKIVFLEHIIFQDLMNTIMYADDHSDNVLPANNNSLKHDNSALELLKHENDHLMKVLIPQDLVHTDVNTLVAINNYKTMRKSFMDIYNETLVLKVELAKKNDMIEKAVYNELLKICSRLKNRYYLKHTQENVDILREIIEHARELRPLDSDLASACKFVTRIQELRVYVSATCPSSKHNLDGVDLLSGSRDTNLYTISLDDMMKSSPISLLSKPSKTKSWLWHRWLSHLNFGKSKKSSHKPKADDTNQEKLYLLHMDLYGQIRVESINVKKYILVIVEDYSRFTQIEPKVDIGIFVGYAAFSSGPAPQVMTPGTLSSGLLPNPIHVVAAPRPVDLTGLPMSTLIDQDAPSTSDPSTQEQEQSLIISLGVEESLKTLHFYDDSLHETLHEDSTSQGSSSNVR